MSCTFWNLRRRKATLAKEKAAQSANEQKNAVNDSFETEKKPVKKGGGKNGK